VNSSERQRLARDLHRAYEIVNDLEDALHRPIGDRERKAVSADVHELRELIWELWQWFKLSGADRTSWPE
jgi:hypothetical protein